MTWAEHLISFYKNLNPPKKLPGGIEWLYPQKDPVTAQIMEKFFNKYYNDGRPRKIFLGINPGRFGAGVTGVNFTAPKQLKNNCQIDHPFKPQSELSAEFIYEVIEAYGGAEKFYADFFIGSVCPLGFVLNGKNLNYYDDKTLLKTLDGFITTSIDRVVDFNADKKICFCIGGEKNYRFLHQLNQKNHWFEHIEALPHPRFIMQYRRKQKEQFIQQYLQAMNT